MLIFRYIEAIGLSLIDIQDQLIFLRILGKFWELSPQFIHVIIEHLLDIKTLSLDAIFSWLQDDVLSTNINELWAWDLLKDCLLYSKDSPLLNMFIEMFISSVSTNIQSLSIKSPELSMLIWIKENFNPIFSELNLAPFITINPIVDAFLALI